MATRIIQIRAGESIFIDFQKQGTEELDDTMEAAFILNDAEGVQVADGVLAKATDNRTFELRIASTTTDPLGVGDYLLLVKVFDNDSGYADYVFEETVRVYA